jgi:hypothetical protein
VITLRTFDSSGPASIAQAALEANGILCSLVDENAHLYSAAAVPIRLLVAEDQVEEAIRVLSGINLTEDQEDTSASGAPTV